MSPDKAGKVMGAKVLVMVLGRCEGKVGPVEKRWLHAVEKLDTEGLWRRRDYIPGTSMGVNMSGVRRCMRRKWRRSVTLDSMTHKRPGQKMLLTLMTVVPACGDGCMCVVRAPAGATVQTSERSDLTLVASHAVGQR